MLSLQCSMFMLHRIRGCGTGCGSARDWRMCCTQPAYWQGHAAGAAKTAERVSAGVR